VSLKRLIVLSFCFLFGSWPAMKPLFAQKEGVNPFHLAPHHATISVADIDKESSWCQSVLGFKETSRTQRGPGRLVSHLTIPGYRLDLLLQEGSVGHPRHGPYGLDRGWLNIVLQTPDINGFYKHLQALGIEVKVDKDAKGGIEHLTFHDPEGNEFGMAPND
jgi:catechol 2,3-dioxygenase-like lactoylglutathione lyase family enzyme